MQTFHLEKKVLQPALSEKKKKNIPALEIFCPPPLPGFRMVRSLTGLVASYQILALLYFSNVSIVNVQDDMFQTCCFPSHGSEYLGERTRRSSWNGSNFMRKCSVPKPKQDFLMISSNQCWLLTHTWRRFRWQSALRRLWKINNMFVKFA